MFSLRLDEPQYTNAFTKFDEIDIRRNNLLTTLNVLPKEYSVSFEVFPTMFNGGGWTNVIHLTTGDDAGSYGARTPAVFFAMERRQLRIISAISGNNNTIYNALGSRINVWTSVKIVQFKSGDTYTYRIFINDTKKFQVVNNDPREFTNVKVYASDQWNTAQPGLIRNIIIQGRNVHYFLDKLYVT